MKHLLISAAALLTVATACGKAEQRPEPADSAVQRESAAHAGTGTIESTSGERVTIAHGPIETIGWPAMTMDFIAPDGLPAGFAAGDEVEFSFRDDGGTYVLTSVRRR